MKFSIITSVFNAEKTIPDTITSLKNQQNIDLEYIVIDGHSQDSTLDIIKQNKDFITKYISEADKGVYDGFNKGLQMATGDIIGFLNADDFYSTEDTLSKVNSVFQHYNSDIVYGDLDYIDYQDSNKIVRTWKAGEFSKEKLKKAWIPPHPSFFFNRKVLEKVPSFNLDYSISADFDFMLRSLLIEDIKVEYLPEVIVKMRTGGVSNNNLTTLMKKISQDAKLLKANKQGGYMTSIYKRLTKLTQWL